MTKALISTGSGEVAQTIGPDPRGEAAILLVESLIHGLVARSVITLEDAIEIVSVATDVGGEIARDGGDVPDVRASHILLSRIGRSLENDVGKSTL